jgi:hemerythrin-like domain-containing protein
MKPRIDFYTKVHKGLRAALFDFSRQAATLDYADAGAVAPLAAALRELLDRLDLHAAHEERFIHPLLSEKLDGTRFDAEHAALQPAQEDLAARLQGVIDARVEERRDRGLAFYRALNLFIARYLEHIDREEQTMPVLWERCTDEELAGVLERFGASRPLAEALADIGWILPALSAPERAELVGGMSASLAGRR